MLVFCWAATLRHLPHHRCLNSIFVTKNHTIFFFSSSFRLYIWISIKVRWHCVKLVWYRFVYLSSSFLLLLICFFLRARSHFGFNQRKHTESQNVCIFAVFVLLLCSVFFSCFVHFGWVSCCSVPLLSKSVWHWQSGLSCVRCMLFFMFARRRRIQRPDIMKTNLFSTRIVYVIMYI